MSLINNTQKKHYFFIRIIGFLLLTFASSLYVIQDKNIYNLNWSSWGLNSYKYTVESLEEVIEFGRIYQKLKIITKDKTLRIIALKNLKTGCVSYNEMFIEKSTQES